MVVRKALTRFALFVIALGGTYAATGRGLEASPRVPSPTRPGPEDVSGFLRKIAREVREIGPYAGEEFIRGEFFLGEGDDDTNKTHQVGILIKDETGAARMTIQVIRLEPSRDNPRIRYGREPRLVICRIFEDRVETARSDYAPAELEKLLPLILRAVVDKKNLLKK